MQNLDTFWRDYNTFEQTNNASKELARSHIAEYQPKNIEARAEFRARRTRREGLTLTTLPVPPRGRAKESSQAQQWRRFIAFDRSNPSALPQSELNGRIVHAFESALAPLYRYPDIWIEYLSYIHETHAAALQLMSSKGNDKESCSAANSESSPAKRIAASLESLLTRAIKALPSNVAVHNHVSWLYPRIGKASKAVGVLDGLCRNHPSPLAYVHLMKATRKHDGRDAARKAFGRARKDPNGAHPCVYVAAALMEFSVNKDSKVARNVFEFGLKNFAKNAVMAAEYVNWLWGTGDLEYARVVMKKVMPDADGSPADIRRLWEKWLELEEVIGDAASVDQVEEMWKDSGVGRSNGVVEDVLRRSRFLGFEGLSEDERAAMDGLRTCNNENIGGSSGNGTGRRDPRTGRRVASSSNKESGGGSTGPRRGDGSSQHTPLTVATEWLKLMAASMPPIAAPAPATDVLFRLIRETPGSYSDTPAGANSNGGGRNGKKDVTGKKRKAEDLGSQNVSVSNMNTGGVVTPPTDVFRARQAAKQSRMR